MEKNKEKRNTRRKKYFLKYSVVIIIGYLITQVASIIAKELGLSSISYKEIIFIIAATVGVTLITTFIVLLKKDVNDTFLQTIVMFQFASWLLLYMFWVYFLHEARIIALLFAFMALIFLATNSNLIQSMIVSIAVVIIQLGSSYYGIHFAQQSGSFTDVVYYTACFFPSALYIAYVAGLFHRKRKELKYAKRDAEEARDNLWGEMEIAKKIQTFLLPERPEINGYDISAYMNPADNIGGDYYDVINVDGHDWIIIGDVSGHGIPAGLIMMMVQSIIRSHVMEIPSIEPSELLRIVNNAVSYNIKNMKEQKFMTITAFALKDDGNMVFSGRHEDILVFRAESQQVEVIKTDGICFSQWALGNNDKNLSLQLKPGDTMLLYTDGVIEAMDEKREMFSENRLVDIFKSSGMLSVGQIQKAVRSALKSYDTDDDVTMLIIQRRK